MTLSKLKYIARFKGYAVYDYSKSVITLILLNLYDRAKKSKAISMIDENGNKYIFIDDNMPYKQQCFALAHELGHIELKHQPTTSRAIGKLQEAEADEYAVKLLNDKELRVGINRRFAVKCTANYKR